LPPSISLDSRADGLYAVVDSAALEDPDTQWLIDRELDRVFFLTCVRLHAEMCRRPVSATFTVRYRIHGSIPQGMEPQQWTDQLSLQLKLWGIAVDSIDPYIKIILFFQIIELSYPDTRDNVAYPLYENESFPPHPRTEAKLLRHLVAHAGEAKQETNRYLQFLGLPSRLSNLVHSEWIQALSGRIPHVQEQAREILHNALYPPHRTDTLCRAD